MSSVQTRLRLYALMTAIEADIRRAISEYILPSKPLEELVTTETLSGLIDRARADDLSFTSPESLILFTQLPDVIHIVVRFSHLLGQRAHSQIKGITSDLNKLVPIRNRVMHSRPLKFDDYFFTSELCQIISKGNPVVWREVSETLRGIENDPAFLLSLTIPVQAGHTERILHNLPAPDFDDTGFIGREDVLKSTSVAIKGPYPVVTITGEGGLGKTAVALKACYDLIDSPDCPFDAVIWTSAKATVLTTHEIVSISDAVKTSIGIFETANEVLDLGSGAESGALELLLAQLKAFRVLLVIDNLETILDENVRRLVREVPAGSKILFTSRVSIGAFDYPIPLPALQPGEAQVYFRALSKFWGLFEFASLPVARINEYIKKLHCNPLFIKWFVQAVARGENPNRILANPKIILEFCLSHVFENLSIEAKRVLETLVFLADGRPASVLSIFCDIRTMDTERSLNELISSNLVNILNYADQGRDQHYQATDLAKFYVRSFVKKPIVDQAEVVRKKKELATTRESILSLQNRTDYDMGRIWVRGEEDIPAAKLLVECQSFIKNKNFEVASKIAQQAIEVSPSFFESHRFLAGILSLQGYLMQAQEAFEAAISLNGKYAPLRLWYGDFLLTKLDDTDAAKAQYNCALEIEPDAQEIHVAIVRLHLIERNFAAAKKEIASLEARTDLGSRVLRRLTSLKFQVELREVERFEAIGDYDAALAGLQNFMKVYSDTPRASIDAKTVKKVGFFSRSVKRVSAFFRGTPSEDAADRILRWFDLSFESILDTSATVSARVSDGLSDEISETRLSPVSLAEGEVYQGVLLRVCAGFGFIICHEQSIFFAFSNWRGVRSPIQSDIGVAVSFRLISDARGPAADEVIPADGWPFDEDGLGHRVKNLRDMEAASKDRDVKYRGILSKVMPGYGFITFEDYKLFFPTASFLGPKPTKADVGAVIEFRLGRNHKGPCATDLRFVEAGKPGVIQKSDAPPEEKRDARLSNDKHGSLSVGSVSSGTIAKLLKGYGFINSEGDMVFFPFGAWKGEGRIAESDIGTTVVFTVGRNHRGICAEDVTPSGV